MVTARTQRSTKVTEEERLDALPEVKRQIRQTDPNLSAQEVERRALIAVGLDPGISAEEADKIMSQPRAPRTRKAVSSGAGTVRTAATSSGARRTIFGIMILAVIVGWVRDVQKGRLGVTDAMPRRIVGAFLSGFILMIIAGPAPRVAKGLAVLIGFSVVAFNVETVEFVSGKLGDERRINRTHPEVGIVGAQPGAPGGIPNDPNETEGR